MQFLKKIFTNFFWGQHPDAAIRYAPVVREIKKHHLQDSKILEIGPGSTGIIPYLNREIDGIDIDFSGSPQTKLLNKIKGMATNLPFRKNSYDVVISVDVLEHLTKPQREQSIGQMLKVAKKLVIIVVPIGELSEKQDSLLKDKWEKVFKEKNQFLSEHVQNGLPKTDEILLTLDREARKIDKKIKVQSYKNLNLTVRKLLMYTWITKSKLMYYLYLKGYLLLLPLFKLANFSDCYRMVFVVESVS